jgi:glucokinase
MRGLYVVISGIPGSGKSTLATELASALRMQVVDRGEIFDQLSANKISDTIARRNVDVESDRLLSERALTLDRAILVSNWHVNGMPTGSGTSTEWLLKSERDLIGIHCSCPPDVAAKRIAARAKNRARSLAELIKELEWLDRLGAPNVGQKQFTIETDGPTGVAQLLTNLERIVSHG